MNEKPGVDPSVAQVKPRYWLWAVIIICSFTVTSWAWNWLKKPTINPSPTQAITIRGQFPFSDKAQLHFGLSAKSTNPLCSVATAQVAGGVGAATSSDFKASHFPDGKYGIRLYKDYFNPGICGWRFSGFGYEIVDDNPRRFTYSGIGTNYSKQVEQCSWRDMSKIFDGFTHPHLTCSTKLIVDRSTASATQTELVIDFEVKDK